MLKVNSLSIMFGKGFAFRPARTFSHVRSEKTNMAGTPKKHKVVRSQKYRSAKFVLVLINLFYISFIRFLFCIITEIRYLKAGASSE